MWEKYSVWTMYLFLLLITLFNTCQSLPIEERNKFILYYGSGSSEVYPIANANDILNSANFDNSKKTVIYFHGYIESNRSTSVQTVVKAYLQRNDYNIILMEWHEDASGDYFFSALPKSIKLGNYLVKIILGMINSGLDRTKLHLVGHSMGGQMIGRIGGGVKKSSKGKVVIKRLSALDPAFPGFYGPLMRHITKNDAEFVDILHTDACLYGAPITTGTVDFWPNGGTRIEPGCPKGIFMPLTENDLCSHFRSWQFWSESLNQETAEKFNAVQSDSWISFKKGNTSGFDKNIVMGNDCPFGLTGNYYLQTNTSPLFAKGKLGTKYSPSKEDNLKYEEMNSENDVDYNLRDIITVNRKGMDSSDLVSLSDGYSNLESVCFV